MPDKPRTTILISSCPDCGARNDEEAKKKCLPYEGACSMVDQNMDFADDNRKLEEVGDGKP